MQEIITGKPYPGPGSDGRPGSIYNCRYGQHQLTVFHDELTPSLLDEIARNPVQLGLWLQGPVLWILFKMAGIPWQEAPFTPLLVEPEGRRFEPLQNGDTRYGIVIILVDTESNLVRSLRLATMSNRMSQHFLDCAQEQLRKPQSNEFYLRTIEQTYRDYPDADGMTANAWMIETLGK